VQAKIDELEHRIEVSYQLVQEAQSAAQQLGSAGGTVDSPQISYLISRQSRGKVEQIEADPTTPILPGDILTVVSTPSLPRTE
jgi:hypothetical protein